MPDQKEERFVPPLGTPDRNKVYHIDHDGFEGTLIGYYVTREGKRGAVLQQVGTRVVHVYGEKWLMTSPREEPNK